MKKLGDQWIEIIDGQEHMVKAVAPIELCKGCCFNCNQGGCCWKGFDDCQMGSFFIIKNLGILNEDGLLPCPFCGEYPVVQPENSRAGFGCHCDKCKCAVSGLHESMQEVMDEWNRRA
jgi:Lar family restriction alleviation protein